MLIWWNLFCRKIEKPPDFTNFRLKKVYFFHIVTRAECGKLSKAHLSTFPSFATKDFRFAFFEGFLTFHILPRFFTPGNSHKLRVILLQRLLNPIFSFFHAGCRTFSLIRAASPYRALGKAPGALAFSRLCATFFRSCAMRSILGRNRSFTLLDSWSVH